MERHPSILHGQVPGLPNAALIISQPDVERPFPGGRAGGQANNTLVSRERASVKL